MCVSTIQKYGANPASIQWKVVRGDTAVLNVDFLQNDEITGFNCTGWTYVATAYDSNGDVLDELVVASNGYSVTITAPASLTINWGSKYKSVVAELLFDLQVIIEATSGPAEDTVWTPIIGTITVIGNVSPGGSL
jgi:hypothetical protein